MMVWTIRFAPPESSSSLPDHGAERNEDANPSCRLPETLDEARDDDGGRHGGHRTQHRRAEDQRQERMDLDDRDEDHDDGDTQEAGQHELAVTGIHGRRVGRRQE